MAGQRLLLVPVRAGAKVGPTGATPVPIRPHQRLHGRAGHCNGFQRTRMRYGSGREANSLCASSGPHERIGSSFTMFGVCTSIARGIPPKS